MEEKDERRLVEAGKEGDRAAYARLVERYSKRIFALCLGMCGRVHDAEDMAQETFIRGFMEMKRLRDTGRFGSWIASIARNLCIDFIRRRRRIPDGNVSERMDRGVAPSEYIDLHEAIVKLPEKYRLPLLLYYFDGRSTESVARTLDISPAGVHTRLSRARRELRELLGAGPEVDDGP